MIGVYKAWHLFCGRLHSLLYLSYFVDVQALEAYQKASECSQGGSKQAVDKVRNIQKLVRQQKVKQALSQSQL